MILNAYVVNTDKGLEFDSFKNDDINRPELEAFFKSDVTSWDELDLQIFNVVRESGFNELLNHEQTEIAVKCFLADLKDRNSCIFRLFEKEYSSENVLEFQCKVFYIVFDGLIKRRFWGGAISGNSEKYYGFYLGSLYYFAAYLDEKWLRSIYRIVPPMFNMDDVLPSQLVEKGIIPHYYAELGAWDRTIIRNNKETMERLKKKWYENARKMMRD